MARERQLPPWREDPQTVVGLLVGRPADERRLREVCPSRDRVHFLARQSVTVKNDRIALERHGSKDFYLLEGGGFHAWFLLICSLATWKVS
jgi:hypothetical protein